MVEKISVPVGFCQCGCGAKTALVTKNNTRDRRIKGQYSRFIPHHGASRCLPFYRIEDRSYKTPCHIWTRSIGKDGYGTIQRNGTSQKAHRWLYQQNHGPIPRDLFLDHLCRQRDCVNDEHLEVVTVAVNNRRGSATRLTPELVRQIKQAVGMPHQALAEQLQVNYKTVWEVRKGIRFADIE